MRTRKFLSTLIPALPMLLTALLVILVTVIFLAAMRSKAHAQFGGAEQPMFQLTSTVAPFTIPYMTNIWIDLDDEDLATGRVTAWASRVNSVTYTSTVTAGPIKETNGVRFFGTNYLAHQTLEGPPGISNAYVVVFNRRTSTFSPWVSLFGATGSERFIGFKGTDNWHHMIHFPAGDDLDLTGPLAINNWYDVIFTGGTNHTTWTNGIFAGAINVKNDAQWGWTALGGNQVFAVADPWVGYIRKVIWWTNINSGLSSNDVYGIHNYLTNKFGYSP